MQNKKIEILPVSINDLQAIGKIESLSGLNLWGIDSYKSELLKDDNFFFIAKSNEKIAGFVFARLIMPEIEIFNIAVSPEFRKQGIGRNLFETILERALESGFRTFWLEVRESNREARRFYEKLGFHKVGRRRNYYQSPLEDAILLEYKLTSDP